MLASHHRYLSWFASFLFVFCLFIIGWGAYVRISHSGDGCGPYWPSCHGEYFIDKSATSKTWIEWTHRATSGLFGLMVLLLAVLAFWKYPHHHPMRKSTLWALFFTITEALLGAGLVLAGLTGSNSSLARALTMNGHLLNSLFLTGSLFICWRLSLGKSYRVFSHFNIFFVIGFLVVAFLGSFSALSSSLFPSTSLWEGFMADFSSDSSYLIRLRLWHPVLAFTLGGGFLVYCLNKNKSRKHLFWKNPLLMICLSLALCSGLLNLILLSPVFLKLTHLLAVYLLEISFLLSLETVSHDKR